MQATFVLSASFVGTALVFAGVAAVAAQIGSDAHVASSLSIGTLGVATLPAATWIRARPRVDSVARSVRVGQWAANR